MRPACRATPRSSPSGAAHFRGGASASAATNTNRCKGAGRPMEAKFGSVATVGTGVQRFRLMFRLGTPNRAARLWAAIKGFADAAGNLTDKGRDWLAPRKPAGRADQGGGAPRARKAGKARARPKVRLRLRVARLPPKPRSSGRRIPAEVGAHDRNGTAAGLPEASPRAPTGLQDAHGNGVNGSGWGSPRARGEPSAAVWRELRAENMRRAGL